jgi:hypothetical protein
MTPDEKKQKAIEWGIAHPNERNLLRQRQRKTEKQAEDDYYQSIK